VRADDGRVTTIHNPLDGRTLHLRTDDRIGKAKGASAADEAETSKQECKRERARIRQGLHGVSGIRNTNTKLLSKFLS
jgi:hypothetical protein